MSEQFSNILNAVLIYEKKQLGIISILFAILITTIIFILIKQIKKISLSNKIVICLIIFVLCIAFVLYIINYCNTKNNIEYDISENCLISYTGEFTLVEYQKDTFYHRIYFFDKLGNEIVILLPDFGNTYGTYGNDFEQLLAGIYNGTIIYSETSKIVVDWNIQETTETGDLISNIKGNLKILQR